MSSCDDREVRQGGLYAPIAVAMREYAADRALAMHTPGHKQGLGAHPLLRELITAEGLREEVSLMAELDDLHAPTACIKEAEELAARLYGADYAYLSVNGTTGALHAMLLGTLYPGDTVLVPRNAHRSLIGGLILAGANPVWLQPEISEEHGIAMGVPLAEIERAKRAHPETRAVVLIYPTYYGVTVDLAAIAAFAHQHGMLLLVDEAHGAHLKFNEALPPQALDCGADAVAQSTHKILGAMTQASLLLTKGTHLDQTRIREAMSLLQTTSPNQLLLASLDIARLQMAEQGRELVGRAVRLAGHLRAAVNEIAGLSSFGEEEMVTPGAAGLDVTKVTVDVRGLGLTGAAAAKILRWQYKIECELADAYNVLFLITYADNDSTVGRLLAALEGLAQARRERAGAKANSAALAGSSAVDATEIPDAPAELPLLNLPPLPAVPPTALDPRDAFFAPKEAVPLAQSTGRVAAEQVMFYPPGIPLLVPGDRITQETIDYLRAMQELGLKVVGPEDTGLKTIKVIRS